MQKFNPNTCAKVVKTGRVGVVIEQNRNKVTLDFFDKLAINIQTLTYKVDELEAVDFSTMKTSQLKEFVRGEITINEISGGSNIISEFIEIDSEPYSISVEDLLAGLNAYEGKSVDDVYLWLDTLVLFAEDMSFADITREYIEDEVTTADILNFAFGEVESLLFRIIDEDLNVLGAEDFKDIRELLELWIKSEGKDYPDYVKYSIAFQFDSDSIDDETAKTQLLFKQCLDYFCDEKKDPRAIQSRGYCYYCGTNIYPNDWVKARDAFIEYYNMTGDASAANTLGYIYYYGRCNGGVPQYDEAFKYFSIGHAAFFYESTYKLADMFAHGYGVVKDKKTANKLYWSVYLDNYERFIMGDEECKFADAALRMGNCFRDEIGVIKDLEVAYNYYLQADFAIRKRMDATDYYGDNVVFSGVQKALSEVRNEYTEHGRTVKFEFPDWTMWTLIKHRGCSVSFTEMKNGGLALDVSPVRHYDEEEAPMMLITVPKADYCDLKKKIRIKTAPNSEIKVMSGERNFVFDHIGYDWYDGKTSFYLFEELVAELYCDYYTFTAPARK